MKPQESPIKPKVQSPPVLPPYPKNIKTDNSYPAIPPRLSMISPSVIFQDMDHLNQKAETD